MSLKKKAPKQTNTVLKELTSTKKNKKTKKPKTAPQTTFLQVIKIVQFMILSEKHLNK